MQKLVLYSLANFSIFTINIKNDPKQKVSRTFHRYGWRSLFINLLYRFARKVCYN
jgi:hypothetical protein